MTMGTNGHMDIHCGEDKQGGVNWDQAAPSGMPGGTPAQGCCQIKLSRFRGPVVAAYKHLSLSSG